MVVILKQEQEHDEEEKKSCVASLDSEGDRMKAAELDSSTHANRAETVANLIESLTSEIKSLTAAIDASDKDVARMTSDRQAANAEFNAERAADIQAKRLLEMAKNRLQKTYNPHLHKSPPEEKSNGGFFFSQISSHSQTECSPLRSQRDAAGGVLEMLSMLIADMDTTLTEDAANEAANQKNY